jgi:hypothetical protein
MEITCVIRTYYLESLVASLNNENVILQTHLACVQRQMKTVVYLAKVRNRCAQLKHKHMAVHTSISSSDFCQMMGSDSDVIQVGSDKMCSRYSDHHASEHI